MWLPSDDDWTAFSSVVTMIVALMVFSEARSIRRAEWILRQNQAWNDINNKVAEIGDGCRIADILEGRPISPPVTPKEAFLLMSFFNVVSSEYFSLRSNLLMPAYALDSFMDTATVVSANKDWLIPFLTQRGYEQSFVRTLTILSEYAHDRPSAQRAVRAEIDATSPKLKVLARRSVGWLKARLRLGNTAIS